MDSKVKQMIKLIEEDADSFARRAEMYYKRRPELLKLVEDFYRAYRALAERYDHATGVIRHAHKTMVEAFPDQVQSMMNGDIDSDSPFMPPSVREFFDPDKSHKDALGLSSPDIHVAKRNVDEEPEFIRSRRGLKQLDFFEKGRARKILNFNEAGEKEKNMNYRGSDNANAAGLNDSNHWGSKHDADILLLKEAVVKLEAEKDAGLLQYQKSLERLSNLEKEIKMAQEESEEHLERASKAEAEVELLNGALIELKAEKELVHLQYQQCLDKISTLEEQIFRNKEEARETSDRAERAESEVQLLKQDIAALQSEKEAIIAQHEHCTETIAVFETKLREAEDNARRTNERSKMAESKIEVLNLAVLKLTEEKEAYSVECQQYRERISSLEFQILFSQEEARRLNEEVSSGVAKLKDAEEHCISIERSQQSLQSELDLLIRKMESKNKELIEKQVELERLWTCAQEERLRFVEAETAFQTLQLLHNEFQEEQTSLASELQNSAQTVLDLEAHNHCLQEEFSKIKDENRTLSEINLSSLVSMENMRGEILTLWATIAKLQEEIEVRVNERNDLQQEIDCLREEFNELKQKHRAVLEQMESLELDPASFGLSVLELRNNCSKLSDAYNIEKSEKAALLEKLEIMAKLREKNAVLENSVASLNTELQQVKEKVKTLEETCQSLIEERSIIVSEKDALLSQFQVLSEKSGVLSEKNVNLENSLASTNDELMVLKENSRRLEESLSVIGIEKIGLLNKIEALSSQLDITRLKLEETEINCEELELKNFNLLTVKQMLICSIDDLRILWNSARQENADAAKCYQTRLACMECELTTLQKELQLTKYMHDEGVDASVRAEIEISILQTYLQELHENNSSLGLKCLELFEAYQTSEKLIAHMEQKIADQLVESKALYAALEKIRMGFFQMSSTLEIDSGIGPECKFVDEIVSYQTLLNRLLENAEDIKKALVAILDENQQNVLEKSVITTLLQQLRLEATDLDAEKYILSQNLKASELRLLKLLAEIHVLSETNKELKRRVEGGDHKEMMLRNDIQELNLNFLNVQGSYKILQQDNNLVLEEKKLLMEELSDLKDTNCVLEEELYAILGDALSLKSMLLVFTNFFSEKSLEYKELVGSMHQLHYIKDALEENVKTLERKLETLLVERSGLRKSLEESNKELETLISISNKLNDDVVNGNELLFQKEMELSEAQIKLESLLNERTKMQQAIEDLKGEYSNLKDIKEKQREQIIELLEDSRLKTVENDDLRNSKNTLEAELLTLVKKHEIVQTTEVTLKSELQRWEIKECLCEKEFEELLRTQQISAFNEACYHEKFHDLNEKLESMLSKVSAADTETQLLKDRIIVLEVENAGLKAHLSEYDSAVSSLSGAVGSLESHTISHDELSKIHRTEDAGPSHHLRKQVCVQEDNTNALLTTRTSELKNLQNRIQVVDLAIRDIQRLASQGSPGSSIRAQASIVHTDVIESGRSFPLESVGALHRQKNHNSDASPKVDELPKDILLDHISDSSSYGCSKREIRAADNQNLELWGTTSKNSSDGMAQKLAGHKKQSSSSEIIAEKEMAVIDKMEISGSSKDPQQKGKNTKISERLLFDAQKLANLQKTVQDLKIKVEISEKSKKTKSIIEYDTVKEQLEEAEEAIDKLFGVNKKLTRTVEDESISSKSLSGNASDESGIVRRRRVLEQIRRASEKISQLHFEVQKLQFLLQKLDSEKEETIKTKVITRSPRVRLRDYLYGGSKPVFAHKQKSRHFCGCVRPSTIGD